jgi:hypothetical protein
MFLSLETTGPMTAMHEMHELLLTDFSVLGSIIAHGALWNTVARVRNVPQSRNKKHDETLRQMAVEEEQLEAKCTRFWK